jgi:hypothetical protein
MGDAADRGELQSTVSNSGSSIQLLACAIVAQSLPYDMGAS